MIGRFEPRADDPVSLAQFEQLRDTTLDVSLGGVPKDLHTANVFVPSVDCGSGNDVLQDVSPVVRDLLVAWQRNCRGVECLEIKIHEWSPLGKGIFSIVRNYGLHASDGGRVYGRTDLRFQHTDDGEIGHEYAQEDYISDARIALFTEWFQLEPLLSMRQRSLAGGDVPFIKREIESFGVRPQQRGQRQ